MSEIFPRPVDQESYAGHETTQAGYVHDLALHVATIPDLSKLPAYPPLSSEEAALIGRYASSYYSSNLEAEGIAPLYREDIIDPAFCKSVDDLTRQITGNSPSYHWYKTADNNYGGPYDRGNSNQARFTSRRWEVAFVGYMRERRMFHAAFMGALLSKEPIGGLVAAVNQPNEVPTTDPNKGGFQPAPEFMYNPTNWLTASLLSALSLSPDHCDAGMKRHAVEQWAKHADINDVAATKGFYGLDKLVGPVRLPWSMRSNADLRSEYHPNWHQNRIVKEYFGEAWAPRADGLEALLQDRPKDYVQILILKTFGGITGPADGLRDLANAAKLNSDIRDIIFASDAAHNTVYSDRSALPEYGQPTSLLEYLENSGGEASVQAQEAIIEGQRLRIRALEDLLAESKTSLKQSDLKIQALSYNVGQLTEALRQLRAAQAEAAKPPQTPAEELMIKYGIHPSVKDEMLEGIVAGIRRQQNRKLHSDMGTGNEALEELKVINGDLDQILRDRNMGKNRE